MPDRPATPDFLFIGAPRAGSTWLYSNLKSHPGIWMPPIKNLNYRHPGAFLNKLRTARQIKDGLIPVKASELGWYLQFFLGNPHNARWYQSLFNAGAAYPLRGEISDDLFVLDTDAIKAYRDINPHLKIFAILRDPIERIFSHIKHNFVNNRGRDFQSVDPAEWRDMLTSPWALDRSRYHAALKKWLDVFGPEQVRIYDHASLHEDPAGLLADICTFIGAPCDKADFSGAGRKVNASQEVAVPLDVAAILWPLLEADMRALPALFPPAMTWVSHYEALPPLSV